MAHTVDEQGMRVMSFGDHLEELRGRVLRSIAVALLGFIVALFFQDTLIRVMTEPHRVAMRRIRVRVELGKLARVLQEARHSLESIPVQWGRREVARLRAAERYRREAAAARARLETRGVEPAVLAYLDIMDHRLRDLSGASARRLSLYRRTLSGAAASGRSLDAIEDGNPLVPTASIEGVRSVLRGIEDQLTAWQEAADGSRGSPPAAGVRSPSMVDSEPSRSQGESDAGGLLERAQVQVAEVLRRLEVLHQEEGRAPLHTFGYPERFFSYLKICALAGILIGLPWITFELWSFVAAGLYPHERKSVAPFLPLSLGGLILGGLFAYYVITPVGLAYLGGYGSAEFLENSFRLSDYLSLVITLLVGMGLVFQLPLVMVFATRAGLATPVLYRKYRKFAILGALTVGALLTPPDIVTQLLMAGPLVLLYEGGVVASAFFSAERRRRSAS